MKYMWAIKEIYQYVKRDEHIAEHDAINEMFNIDCDSLTHEEHTKYHLEYRLRKGLLTEKQKELYLGTK